MRHRLILAPFALAAALALTGCNSKTVEPPPGGGVTHTITIQNFAFVTATGGSTLTIPAGDKVQWKNLDSASHTATSDNGNFINTGTLAQNATSTAVTFTGAATFTYHCAFHTNMLGTIIVQ